VKSNVYDEATVYWVEGFQIMVANFTYPTPYVFAKTTATIANPVTALYVGDTAVYWAVGDTIFSQDCYGTTATQLTVQYGVIQSIGYAPTYDCVLFTNSSLGVTFYAYSKFYNRKRFELLDNLQWDFLSLWWSYDQIYL
jgi:hypothetical protein